MDRDERFLLEGVFVSLPSPCDLRCRFCYPQRASKVQEGAADFSLPQTLDFLARAYPLLVKKELTIGGNEPMNFPELPELLAGVRKLGFKKIILMTASRRLADSAWVKKLIASGVNAFNIPLYGPIADVHDPIVGVPGSFEKTLEGLRSLHRHKGVETIVHTLVLKQNFDVFRETSQLASGHTSSGHLQVWFFEPQGHTHEEYKEFVVAPDILRQCLASSPRHCDFFGFPLCFLPLWARRSTESWMKNHLRREILWVSQDGVKPLNQAPYYLRHPEKFPTCQACPWRLRCRSVHPDYLDIFGATSLGFPGKAS
jgi:MoaA/NifB/PqqE/SkfB family radical SAM enzyme